MKTLYPEIIPFHHFFLQTNSVHSVYVEQSGNPQGIPIIFLHGGPCSGTKPSHRQFFNPEKYHIILMDQRGCGQSLPFGEIKHNTTQDLIDDMEQIRKQLGFGQWLLYSGSWGSTLALLYVQQHTSCVSGMIIRGVFLARKKDLDWFAKDGAGRIYPEKWEQLISCIPESARADWVKGLHSTLFGQDEVNRRRAAKAWLAWSGQVVLMQDYSEDEGHAHITKKMVQQVQMEIHYAFNKYFITENQVLEACDLLQDIPTIIIHGRRDLVCPIEAGDSLHKALPKAEYLILPNAGHISSSEDMTDALVDATDRMLELI